MTAPLVIIGRPDDAQVEALIAAAERRSRPVRVLRFSDHRSSDWVWDSDGLSVDGFRLDEASGIFVRSIPILLPQHHDERVAAADQDEWLERAEKRQRLHGFYKSVQLALADRGVPVVNPLWGFAYHRSKPAADLALAHRGIPVPRGVATSDPAAIRALMDEVGAVVYKPVAGGGRCRVLDPDTLERDHHLLRRTAVYAQELIPGRNLRVYTLDDRVIAAFDIESDDVDFRGEEKRISTVRLDPAIERTAIEAARVLELPFAGSDIKLTPEGEHIVLDVNPSPMFAGLDRRIDWAISDSLVEKLTEAR